MEAGVPKRIATAIINSLKGGVVPRVGLEYVVVGRKAEIEALLHDVDIIKDGGATFRYVVGKYGSGKSFLLQIIRNHATKQGLVVVDADLSPERRLTGQQGQGLATYRELIKNMSTNTKPDGGALPLILEKWISAVKLQVASETNISPDSAQFNEAVYKKIYAVINEIEGMVNGFDFGRVIAIYYKAAQEGDDEKKSLSLRWFKGEYTTKTEAKKDLGVTSIITDANWYDYIKILAVFLVKAGYKGMLVLIDEIVNIFKLPNTITRQYNYEKMLMMYNDTLQGKAEYLGIIMGGTPQSVEDPHKGVFSYEALKSRLSEGRFSTEGMRDLMAPIIRLEALTGEELYILIEKLKDIHADLYKYEAGITQEELTKFLEMEYSRVGADSKITPREIIRDFVELLNIVYQNPDKTIIEVMGADEFEFAKNAISDEKIHAEFADFEV
ncbi:MAG: ATP-binding protein [Christensenellaceae bacterium]